MTAGLPERMVRHITVSRDCWEWDVLTWNGYGTTVWINGRRMMAHRATYTCLVGPIPEGLDLDHLCRNRRCVNPAHLEPVTRSENLRRGVDVGRANARKSHCKQGHPFSEENTYLDARGWRGCQTCRADSSLRHKRARRAA